MYAIWRRRLQIRFGLFEVNAHDMRLIADAMQADIVDRLGSKANDDLRGATLATRHLIDLGHRRIAHISGRVSGTSNVVPKLRQQGYQDTMQACGLGEHIRVEWADFTEDGGYRATVRLLSSPEPPTAIFAANDMMAIGAIEALRARGKQVPEDVAVAGFDDVPLASHLGLTTVRVRIAELGERAIGRLIRMLEGEEDSIGEELHAPELVIRGSTIATTSIR